MRPRPLAGEVLEERRGDDRIAEAAARRCCADRRRATPAGAGSAGAAATATRGRRPRCRRRRPRRARSRRWRRRRRRGRPSRPASRRSASRGRRRASRPRGARTRARRRGSGGPRRRGSSTSTVRPAAVLMTSDGRIASGPIMFSQAGRTPSDVERQPELGDRAERGEHGGAAAHVALLAHDVRLRLEEVAARVEGDGLADEREPRPLGARRRLVAQDDQLRRLPRSSRRPRRARGSPAATGSSTSTLERRAARRRARRGRPGVTTFGGASTSSRATFVQRATSSARAAIAAMLRLVGPADDEALDAAARVRRSSSGRRRSRRGRRPRRAPHLAVRAIGSESSSAHATVPPPRLRAHGAGRRRPQVLGLEPRRASTSATRRARSSRVDRHAPPPGRRRPRRGASRPSNSASSSRTRRPPAASARTSASTSAGVGGGHLDLHRVRAGTCRSPEVIAVSIIARCAFGSSARPPAAASRSGTATARPARPPAPAPRSPRTQSSLAIRGAEGPWFLANASPDLRQQLEALAADGADGVRAAPVAGVLLTDAEIDHTAGLLLLRESSTADPRVRQRRRSAAR